MEVDCLHKRLDCVHLCHDCNENLAAMIYPIFEYSIMIYLLAIMGFDCYVASAKNNGSNGLVTADIILATF